MNPSTDDPGSTPSTCPSCGSSDLERFTLGETHGWWCRACDDLWADQARIPHAFDPMTFTGPDGPGVADWCGVIGCAKPAADPIHAPGGTLIVCDGLSARAARVASWPIPPHPFQPWTPEDGPGAGGLTRWCGRKGCAWPEHSEIHDPRRHPPTCVCTPCLGKAAQA